MQWATYLYMIQLKWSTSLFFRLIFIAAGLFALFTGLIVLEEVRRPSHGGGPGSQVETLLSWGIALVLLLTPIVIVWIVSPLGR